MKSPGYNSVQSVCQAALVCFCALTVYGCSSSSTSGSPTSASLEDELVNESIDSVEINEPSESTVVDTQINAQVDTQSSPVVAEPSSPVVPDPLIQNLTRVNFNIMVPAYQSNALQVRIVWGEKDLRAAWIGDESWSVSDDFPSNVENTLMVWFYDNNGGITLGTVERIFSTGLSSAQDVSINAADFNIESWDDDSDGVSNFEELSLGTNPLEANNSAEIDNINLQETLAILYSNWSAPAAAYYEPEFKLLELPANIQDNVFVDNLPFSSDSRVTDIVITADGNGTYLQTSEFNPGLDMPFNTSSIATRNSRDNTVAWSGTEAFSGSSAFYGAVEHEFETVNTIASRTLTQQGNGTVTLKREASANRANIVRYNYNLVLDLDSKDEANLCSILHGTTYHSFERNIEMEAFTEFTASRNSLAENWVWSNTVDGETSGGEALDVSGRLYCDYRFD